MFNDPIFWFLVGLAHAVIVIGVLYYLGSIAHNTQEISRRNTEVLFLLVLALRPDEPTIEGRPHSLLTRLAAESPDPRLSTMARQALKLLPPEKINK